MNPLHKLGLVLIAATAVVLGAASPALAASCCATHAAPACQEMAQADTGHEGHAGAGHESHMQSDDTSAGDTPKAGSSEEAEAKPITVTGTNYCVGCSVTDKESAMAECKRSGHKMAIKVKNATASDGSSIPELKGRVLRYAEGEHAKALADRALWGKQVTLDGTISENSRRLNVTNIVPKSDLYTCPMHPEVVSDKPGDCPKCGMKLVEKKEDSSQPSENAPAEHDHSGHHH